MCRESRRGLVLLVAVLVVVAIVLVVVAPHHSSPKQNVAIYDQNGHVVSVSRPTPSTYVYTYNANVVAVKYTHANRKVELRATTPSKLQSPINRDCR